MVKTDRLVDGVHSRPIPARGGDIETVNKTTNITQYVFLKSEQTLKNEGHTSRIVGL